jgi:hypothetical protein
MPKGVHTSVRVAMAVPPKLHEQLAQWADYEGRPVASLCLFLVEQGLRQAQADGIAPSNTNPEALTGLKKAQLVTRKVVPTERPEITKETTDSKLLKALLKSLAED